MALALPTARGRRWVPPGSRHDAELDLGLCKAGAVGGNDQIAHHGQLTAAPQGDAFDGCDDGLADSGDGFPVAGDEVVTVGIHEIVVAHGSDIGTGGKGAGVPRQDDGTISGLRSNISNASPS